MTKKKLDVWTFYNATLDEEVDVEAEGFDEACNIMFGDLGDGTEPYDYHEWELTKVNGRY